MLVSPVLNSMHLMAEPDIGNTLRTLNDGNPWEWSPEVVGGDGFWG